MDVQNVLTTIYYFWAPLLLFVLLIMFAVFYFYYKKSTTQLLEYRQSFKDSIEQSRRHIYGLEKDMERLERFSPKINEELYFRLNRIENLIERTLMSEIPEKLSEIETLMNEGPRRQSNSTAEFTFAGDQDIDTQLIRELSHSLNTPLSQIEVLGTTLVSSFGESKSEINQQAVGAAKSIVASVEIIKSFMGAYRELTLVKGQTEVWKSEDLSELLRSATHVYAQFNKKVLLDEIKIPKEIPGYSNNYITALLLPLIENGVEASVNESSLKLSFVDKGENFEISVLSEPNAAPGGDEIYDLGFTTKDGHEGAGLSTIRRLLREHRGANLTHEFRDPTAIFTISLPRRQA